MRIITYALISVAAFLQFTCAFAGMKSDYEVVISNTHFAGSLGSVRNSDDDTQYIYCTDYGSHASCTARDSDGTTKSCVTTDSDDVNVIHGLIDSSYLTVGYSNGTCYSVKDRKGSQYAPKKK
jgi:hypothetical protein